MASAADAYCDSSTSSDGQSSIDTVVDVRCAAGLALRSEDQGYQRPVSTERDRLGLLQHQLDYVDLNDPDLLHRRAGLPSYSSLSPASRRTQTVVALVGDSSDSSGGERAAECGMEDVRESEIIGSSSSSSEETRLLVTNYIITNTVLSLCLTLGSHVLNITYFLSLSANSTIRVIGLFCLQ